MANDRKAQIVTVAVLVVALGIGLSRKLGWPGRSSAPGDPQDAVYAMLAAARAGDVKAYLAFYTGSMEAALRQTLSETSETDFAKYLRDTNAAIKGVAVSGQESTSDREARVRVEYIYEDRNEAQTIYLERSPAGWKISRTSGDERVKTLIPYGTPVK